MGRQARRATDDEPRGLAPEHDGDVAHAAGASARGEAVDHRPWRQGRGADRGDPRLERDPYQDEGGEG